MNKARVETFSDGVFAIAITLLVLTIAQPVKGDYSDLSRALLDRWPALAAYAVSFVVIGIMWVNHHTVFSHLQRVDRGLFYWNLALLMTIVFIPYPTEVFGEALRLGHGARTAAVLYSITMTVNALMWTGLWLHAARGRRLLHDEFPESQRRVSTLLFNGGAVLYLVSIGMAFISAYLCLVFQAVLAFYYALDPISRRLEHRDPEPS